MGAQHLLLFSSHLHCIPWKCSNHLWCECWLYIISCLNRTPCLLRVRFPRTLQLGGYLSQLGVSFKRETFGSSAGCRIDTKNCRGFFLNWYQRYPFTGLDRTLGVQEVEVPRISGQSAYESGEVVSSLSLCLSNTLYLYWSYLIASLHINVFIYIITNFARCTVWVWNLVANIKGGT